MIRTKCTVTGVIHVRSRGRSCPITICRVLVHKVVSSKKDAIGVGAGSRISVVAGRVAGHRTAGVGKDAVNVGAGSHIPIFVGRVAGHCTAEVGIDAVDSTAS